jgi:hypothetical protein
MENNREVPILLKKLLEPYPAEIQLQFREAIEKLHIQNPNDPIFELMLVLGLWGTYYQKISGQIVAAGEQMKAQNETALKSLDERVRMLQGLTQTIQQATDKLETNFFQMEKTAQVPLRDPLIEMPHAENKR